jgi:hypothetical protein
VHYCVVAAVAAVAAVATVVACRAGRFTRLIYLDAFVPEDGLGLFDLAPLGAPSGVREQARLHGVGMWSKL